MRDKEVQLQKIYVSEETEEDQWSLKVVEVEKISVKEELQITELVEEYSDILQEPTSLPPYRENHDHKITLVEGSNPVNQKPYRYAVYQKDEIDKMVKELLDVGKVQPSSSAYASPVVLVKKKDNTWRLCVDYRKLNNMTIKNMFPIL